MKRLNTIQAVCLSAMIGASCALASDTPDFLVEMRIVDSGVEVATPRIMIKEGVEGSMSISGDDGMAVGLVVTSASENEAFIIAKVESGENSMSPELLIQKGQWTSVSVADLEFHVRVERLGERE
jgi:hypothetical protein